MDVFTILTTLSMILITNTKTFFFNLNLMRYITLTNIYNPIDVNVFWMFVFDNFEVLKSNRLFRNFNFKYQWKLVPIFIQNHTITISTQFDKNNVRFNLTSHCQKRPIFWHYCYVHISCRETCSIWTCYSTCTYICTIRTTNKYLIKFVVIKDYYSYIRNTIQTMKWRSI